MLIKQQVPSISQQCQLFSTEKITQPKYPGSAYSNFISQNIKKVATQFPGLLKKK